MYKHISILYSSDCLVDGAIYILALETDDLCGQTWAKKNCSSDSSSASKRGQKDGSSVRTNCLHIVCPLNRTCVRGWFTQP